MGQLLTKKKEEFAPARVRPTVSTSSQYFANYAELFKTHGIIPDIFLVHEAPSCQYIDEDGDVANEFLAEETDGKKSSLRKIVKNITPKGKEKYAIPRLRSDIPVVLWELAHNKTGTSQR